MRTLVKQGACFSPCIKLTYKKTGAPVNLTGCTAFSQMRKEPGGELVATGVCDVNTSSGRITVTYDSNATENIPKGEYGYDVWLVVNGDESKKRPIWNENVTIIGRYTDNFSTVEPEQEPEQEQENG